MTDWDAGGWEGTRRAQADDWLVTTPVQRLAWLEEAIAFVRTVHGPHDPAVGGAAPRS